MTESTSTNVGSQIRGLARAVMRPLIGTLGFVCRVLLIAWGALAIHWSNLPWAPARTVLAVVFVGVGVAAFWVIPSQRWFRAFAALFLGLLVWWAMIQPSHDREWRKEVQVLPRASIDGDRVTITGVRDFDYRTASDFDVRYTERVVDLAHVVGVDFFVSYWAVGPVAHTFVSFIFDNADPVCVSIEARLEAGESYSPVASCFKQAELIYIVAEERDVVRVRTNYRKEMVYLYHVKVKPESARRLFVSYLSEINRLADEPEFYHLLRNNCTTNIDRHAHKTGKRGEFDMRKLLNGYVDAYIYAKGALDSSIPFAELRERSLINEAALAADQAADFSARIRASLTTLDQ